MKVKGGLKSLSFVAARELLMPYIKKEDILNWFQSFLKCFEFYVFVKPPSRGITLLIQVDKTTHSVRRDKNNSTEQRMLMANFSCYRENSLFVVSLFLLNWVKLLVLSFYPVDPSFIRTRMGIKIGKCQTISFK